METRRALSIYLRPHLFERIEAAAKADGRSVSNYVERALDSVTPMVPGERVAIPSRFPESVPTDTPQDGSDYDMLWVSRGTARNRRDGKRRVVHKEIPVKVLRRGPHATGDAGPGSGWGSKVNIMLEGTGQVTSVYARNLKPRGRGVAP
jgi:hypothetical protein